MDAPTVFLESQRMAPTGALAVAAAVTLLLVALFGFGLYQQLWTLARAR
jgi:hypothetical protein